MALTTRRSAFWAGSVMHARMGPVEHRFRYRLYMTGLDLDELPTLFDGRWLWSLERFNVVRFRRADHLGDPAVPLREAVRDEVERRLGRRPAGRVLLLTHLGQFGYRFNPVSFYLCHDASDRLDAIVAEVNNTPWGEQHCYVLDAAAQGAGPDGTLEFHVPKAFVVSPFLPLDMDYRFRFAIGPDRFRVTKENWQHGERVFVAHMDLRRRAMTPASMARVLVEQPLITWKVVGAIYWQALRLWLKGVRFLGHGGGLRTEGHS